MQSAVQDVGVLIDKLAAKLAVPAAHIWEVLKRQANVEAMTNVSVAAIWVFVAALAIYVGGRLLRLLDEAEADFAKRYTVAQGQHNYVTLHEPDYGDTRALLVALRWIVTTLCLVAAANYAIIAARYTMNPDYYALQTILETLK